MSLHTPKDPFVLIFILEKGCLICFLNDLLLDYAEVDVSLYKANIFFESTFLHASERCI